MKEQTEYEIDKQKRKQLQVRNEFLYYGESQGKYEFPIIHKQDIDVNKIKFLSYVDSKKEDGENKDKTIHFFTYDWLFEKVYEKPDEELEKLSQYYALLSPDFSMWTNMPLALQIESCFKNRWCGAYWQSKGLKVIPTVSWSDEKSFDWCFDGIEEGSIVAVSTYYRENCENDFMKGYNKMIEKIKPSAVLCYDEPFKAMQGNVIEFLPTTYEWTKNLNWKELAQFKWEKRNKNVLGLNPKDFKYFEYDDPYEKIDLKACDVCGKVVAIDQFGFGDCENCGWIQDPALIKMPDKVMYPNRISLNKAKNLYKQGKKLEPDLNDFLDGLFMYSEMVFTYSNIEYEVFLKPDRSIVFCSFEIQQEYKNREDFYNKANINGLLLKDIWDKVTNADYMQG
jgi:hypothetical protein